MEINRLSSPLAFPNSSRFLLFPSKFFFACRTKVQHLSPSTPNSSTLFFHRYSSSSIVPRNLVAKMSTGKVDSGNMIYQPILEKGIFRFDCSSDDRNAAFPSLSFADSKLRETTVTSNAVPSFVPTFEKASSEQQIVTLVLPEGTNFYETGEASGPLERTGKRVMTILFLLLQAYISLIHGF